MSKNRGLGKGGGNRLYHKVGDEEYTLLELAEKYNMKKQTVYNRIGMARRYGLDLKETLEAPLKTKFHRQKRDAKKQTDSDLAPLHNTKFRKCLKCQKEFFSAGTGNRICAPCKDTTIVPRNDIWKYHGV